MIINELMEDETRQTIFPFSLNIRLEEAMLDPHSETTTLIEITDTCTIYQHSKKLIDNSAVSALHYIEIFHKLFSALFD